MFVMTIIKLIYSIDLNFKYDYSKINISYINSIRTLLLKILIHLQYYVLHKTQTYTIYMLILT